MPVVLREGPYRFFFYMGDGAEPPHVHVERDDRVAKFWLNPARCQRSGGMRPVETRRIQRIIEDNHTLLMDEWNARFNN